MSSKSFGSIFVPTGVATQEASKQQEQVLIVPTTGDLVINFMKFDGLSNMTWKEASQKYICDLLTGAEPKARRNKKRTKSGRR